MYIGEAYGGPKDPGAAKSSLSLKRKEQGWRLRQQDDVILFAFVWVQFWLLLLTMKTNIWKYMIPHSKELTNTCI